MKKNIKIALLFITIGLLLMAIGYAFGGTIRKKDFSTASDDVENTSAQKIVIENTVQNLFINVDTGIIRIIPHHEQGFCYTVTDNSDKADASVYTDGTTLKVTTNHTKKWFGNLHFFGFPNKPVPQITVYIPENTVFDTADITTGTAETVLKSFTIQERFILHTGIGETTVQNVTAHNVSIETGIGENIFDNCTFTDTSMETGIGETAFSGILLGASVIKSSIGETNIRIHKPRDFYTVSVTSGIGDVFINGSKASKRHKDLNTDRDNKTAKHLITVKSGIGTIELDFL